MKRKISLLVLALSLTTVLAACGSGTTSVEPTPSASAAPFNTPDPGMARIGDEGMWNTGRDALDDAGDVLRGAVDGAEDVTRGFLDGMEDATQYNNTTRHIQKPGGAIQNSMR